MEADPARTINILPPVAGRVVKLRVGLGDRVVKDQPLAVIDSGDLAQAYSDDDKARDALQHTERTLERVRGLRNAGAGSLKDLEQAESDYAQAKAEFNRAEARLKEIGVPSQPKDGLRLLTITAPTAGSVTGAHDGARSIRQRFDRTAHDDCKPQFCLGHGECAGD